MGKEGVKRELGTGRDGTSRSTFDNGKSSTTNVDGNVLEELEQKKCVTHPPAQKTRYSAMEAKLSGGVVSS